MADAGCKNCNKAVIWAETSNGKNILLEEVQSKHLRLDGSGRLMLGGYRVRTVIKGQAVWATEADKKLLRPLYICHWDRCKK